MQRESVMTVKTEYAVEELRVSEHISGAEFTDTGAFGVACVAEVRLFASALKRPFLRVRDTRQ